MVKYFTSTLCYSIVEAREWELKIKKNELYQYFDLNLNIKYQAPGFRVADKTQCQFTSEAWVAFLRENNIKSQYY